MSSLPTQFAAVTVVTKANVYFDGNVVSHTVLFADASKKTLGLIRPGIVGAADLDAGKVTLLGARYDLDTGKVEWVQN
jgi:uncharacterized protein YaiE (UPF0345 family)